MTASQWTKNVREYYRELPAGAATKYSAVELADGLLRRGLGTLSEHYWPDGEPIFEAEWDVLIVLDACRVDALATVADEYDWLDDLETTRSVGSWSRGWMRENFTPEYAADMTATGHVTWNAFTDFETRPDEWALLDEVWRDTWDDDRGCLPPAAVTDRAGTAVANHSDIDQWLVHYQQPHAPFRGLTDEMSDDDLLTHDMVGVMGTERTTVWDRLQRGTLSRDRAWDAYLDNLRWVLDDLPRLLAHFDDDTDVVVTADHGECFGRCGVLYGHPRDIWLPELITVPWVTVDVSGIDAEPAAVSASDADHTQQTDDTDVNERLANLGYV